MNGIISSFLGRFDGKIALAIAGVYGLNILLTGLKKSLDRVQDKAKILAGADSVVTKVVSVLSKVIEYVTANSILLPPLSKAEAQSPDAPVPAPVAAPAAPVAPAPVAPQA